MLERQKCVVKIGVYDIFTSSEYPLFTTITLSRSSTCRSTRMLHVFSYTFVNPAWMVVSSGRNCWLDS
jgi:hypothetical protein